MQIHIYIEFVYFVFPFFVHFVFEGELDIAAIHFHGVYEKQRYFVLIECLSFHYIVDYRFRFVPFGGFEVVLYL